MKLMQFIFLLFRRGKLNQKPVDFESKRKQLVETLQLNTIDVEVQPSNKRPSRFWKVPGFYSTMAAVSYFRDRRDMNKMYYVSDSHKVVFIRILKAAGTSILSQFLGLIDSKLKGVSMSDEQVDALGYYFARRKLRSAADKYEKFVIVRNPYERIVSVYLDLFDTSAEIFSYEAYWFGILDRSMSFKDFIRVISKVPISLLGPHFCPQYNILKETPDAQLFRLEKDHEELTQFLKRYEILLPHRNRHKVEYDYRSFYDAETFSLVKDLYREDVNRFDFKSEQNELEKFVSN